MDALPRYHRAQWAKVLADRLNLILGGQAL